MDIFIFNICLHKTAKSVKICSELNTFLVLKKNYPKSENFPEKAFMLCFLIVNLQCFRVAAIAERNKEISKEYDLIPATTATVAGIFVCICTER